MADQQNTINNRIVFTGLDEAGKQIATLKQRLKEIRDAKDRAFQSQDNQSMFKGEIKSFKQLGELEKSTYRSLQEFESGLTKQIDQRAKKEAAALKAKQDDFRKFLIEQDNFDRKQELAITKAYEAKRAADDKAYKNYIISEQKKTEFLNEQERKREQLQTQAYEKYQQSISNARAKQNAESSKQIYIDEKASNKKIAEQLKQQMNPVTLAMQSSDINSRWQQNYLDNYGKDMGKYAENAKKLKTEAADVTTKINQMGTAFETSGKKADYLGSFMQKLRSHFNWLSY